MSRSCSSCGIFVLSDDDLVRVFSFLWFRELAHLRGLHSRLRSIADGNNQLMFELVACLMQRNGAPFVDANAVRKAAHGSSLNARLLASRLPVWPSEIDTTCLKYELSEVLGVPGQTSKCVAYTGIELGKNRCFVANHHFPVLSIGSQKRLDTSSTYPFTKVVHDATTGHSIPMTSGIAYFEITIHKASARHVDDQTFTPCVSIGLANHMHRLNKMPGWDKFSSGFHGDDGLYFMGCEWDGMSFASNDADAKFGEGDTVGLGVLYPSFSGPIGRGYAVKYLTINGKFIGGVTEFYRGFDKCTWFPCVGTDCHCPIEMNFGNKGVPFMFDVIAFEKMMLRSRRKCERYRKLANRKKKGPKVKLDKDGLMRDNKFPTFPTLPFRHSHPTSSIVHPQCESNNTCGLFRNPTFMAAARAHMSVHAVCTEESESDSESDSECDFDDLFHFENVLKGIAEDIGRGIDDEDDDDDDDDNDDSTDDDGSHDASYEDMSDARCEELLGSEAEDEDENSEDEADEEDEEEAEEEEEEEEEEEDEYIDTDSEPNSIVSETKLGSVYPDYYSDSD